MPVGYGRPRSSHLAAGGADGSAYGGTEWRSRASWPPLFQGMRSVGSWGAGHSASSWPADIANSGGTWRSSNWRPASVSDPSVRLRFLAEAKVLASIDSPHIVPVYDYIEHDDACILVMERLGGGTVWSRFVDRGFDQRSACVITMVACSGLSAAHLHGVLHRDMKPENVLFGEDNASKVTDFGIARVLGEDDTLATREGEILGNSGLYGPRTGQRGRPRADDRRLCRRRHALRAAVRPPSVSRRWGITGHRPAAHQ